MKKIFLIFLAAALSVLMLVSCVFAYEYDYYEEYGYYEENYTEDNPSAESDEWTPMTYILPSLIVGFIISLIVVLVMRASMKSVKLKHGAADYMIPGSLKLTGCHDTFLYRNVTRTKRNTNNRS